MAGKPSTIDKNLLEGIILEKVNDIIADGELVPFRNSIYSAIAKIIDSNKNATYLAIKRYFCALGVRLVQQNE